MTAIAQELDAKMRTLDEKSATSLERLVRDALDLVDLRPQTLPADFFTRIAQEFGPDPFERPPQGQTETRDSW